MKNLKDALTNRTSAVFTQLQALTSETKRLRTEADRIEELNQRLTYKIQNGQITDQEQVNCALAWLFRSNLSVDEILEKI